MAECNLQDLLDEAGCFKNLPPYMLQVLQAQLLCNIATSPGANLDVYADNAAAIAGGLAVGAFYRTGADPDVVAVVHA